MARERSLDVPALHPEYCKGCERCVPACAHGCLAPGSELHPLSGLTPVSLDLDGCTGCGLCIEACPAKNKSEPKFKAINLAAHIFEEAKERGYAKMNLLDIGGGFPAPYDATVKPFRQLARILNRELDRLFPPEVQILAEPGRFMVASAGPAISTIIGKAVRDGKLCYYVDDGVYHTFSGVIFDHCQYHFQAFKGGPKEVCSVFGPTCDALDVVSMAEQLPGDLKLGDLLYSINIGAYSHASATHFNGFPPAKVVHINR